MNFEFGDGTDLHNGCAATLLGEFWYFGGGGGASNPYIRQVIPNIIHRGDSMIFIFHVPPVVVLH